MKSKIIIALLALCITAPGFTQTNLNQYKYIIIPKKFDFLSTPNQYRMNDLAQFLFKKYHFQTLMEGENYPEDLIKNRCLALRSEVLKNSSLFKTKLKVQLTDCNDKIIYVTPSGESKMKAYNKAYNEAMRNAFKAFKTISYHYYSGNPTVSPPLTADIPNATVQAVQTTSNPAKPSGKVLYAQETPTGFQLVDSSPKVVFKIQRTSLDHVYLVSHTDALIYKKGNTWYIEYYKGGVRQKDLLNIKF